MKTGAKRAVSKTRPASGRMWGGRFGKEPSPALRRLNDSFTVDQQMLEEDIEGSIAWAGALRAAGALSAAQSAAMVKGLRQIAAEAKTGSLLTDPRGDSFEDVHSYVEAALASRIGPLAGKLHTGRSRNDQVATDLRLYLIRALSETRPRLLDLCEALARRAVAESATPMPGYTHMKQAEPITFGHWCLAYVEMLLRDVSRISDAISRGDECPLGSGALSGTPLPIDRAKLAASLGFSRPCANSLDAVSDRDLAVEFLFTGSLILSHLSRMAEDLILFSTDEFAFVALPDDLATGSSRMPHKKNPDLLELVRGHAARAIGDLTGLLSLIKGLPLAYNKDLQLDKEPVFRLRATLGLVLPVVTELIQRLTLDRGRMRRAASGDGLLATEVADTMAARGIPFRRAHGLVGSRIAAAEHRGVTLSELGPGGGIEPADLAALDVVRSLKKRASAGGTAPALVKKAARDALRAIAKRRAAGSP